MSVASDFAKALTPGVGEPQQRVPQPALDGLLIGNISMGQWAS